MYQKKLILSLAILFSFSLNACNNPIVEQAQTTPTTSIESTNTTQQTPQESAKRIVALTSLTADIIHQLDQNKLVGITGSSLLNKDPRFQDIQRVAQGQTPPNLEKILALQPDLVIGAEGFSDKTLKQLQELGIATFATRVNNWQSLQELTKTLAGFIDADPTPLLNRYQTFLPNDLQASNSTLVLVSRQPILTPNKNSWAGDLLSQFQVNNLAADLQGNSPMRGYITLSAEKVLEANPEVIILISPPQGGSETALLNSFKQESFWQNLQAAKNNQVYVFDYYGLVNAGSIDAIEKATRQLKQTLSKQQPG
ncbi:MAG: ABC transporter substrate-binding protein [Nodularia sp. (in: Bacteria)]|nr:MAG: ABC transporter substrate-binding protein [Nodularia sp. (in: cyanobacteria)]